MIRLRKPFNAKSYIEYRVLNFKFYGDFSGSELEKYLIKKGYRFEYTVPRFKALDSYGPQLISIKVPEDKYRSMFNLLKKMDSRIANYREEIVYY